MIDISVYKYAVLFASKNSIYKTFEEADVYDIDRNALSFNSSIPIIAHPPCRSFSRLSHFSNPTKEELIYPAFCLLKIYENGGIFEHPAFSKVFDIYNLPKPGHKNKFGFTISIDQRWFNLPVIKNTWLFISGCSINEIPPTTLNFNAIEYQWSPNKNKNKLKHLPKSFRAKTTIEFASYLISIIDIILKNKTL